MNLASAALSIPDYELVRVVGRGSYGDVWLARGVTGAWRAIKVVWRDRFVNAEPFEREFRGLKQFADVSLDESSQMTLLHVGRNDAAGFFYYVMELADDAERNRQIDPATYVPLTLAEMRARRGRIPADECARIGIELARVLASLHRRGLVHRDVKPSNVILVSGVPKLADIGLVAPSASAHTFVGTEGYVPPEGPGAPSADVFALAKVLYELSTGHDRQEFPKLPADLAHAPDRAALFELNEIFLRACGTGPHHRYLDGAAILADLTALNAGVSLRSRRLAAFVLRIAASIALVAALGGGAWLWITRSVPPPPPLAAGIAPRSVAVLPFVNATGDLAQEFLAYGISDEILHGLERERDLRVAGSRSAFWVKGQNLSSAAAAKALRVAHVVEGSIQLNGDAIQLEVRLTGGGDGASESLGAFKRERRDLFALEDEVARVVAQKLLNRVTMPALVAPTGNLAAYGAFLRGRMAQVDRVERASEAIHHFEHAVALDPHYAVAWARLADARRTDATKDIHGIWSYDHALAAVNRALELQPALPMALAVRGLIWGVGNSESPDGLRDLDRAEKLGGPNAETRMNRFLLGFYASETQGLLPVAQQAIESNPENPERLAVIVLALSYLGEYAEADRLSRRPEDFVMRVALRRTWRGAEAALRLARRAAPNPTVGIAMSARLLRELGRTDDAAKLLDGATEPQPWDVYAAAGKSDDARTLARAELPGLRTAFDGLSGRPRNESEMLRKDDARGKLIAAEIALGSREDALVLLDAWRLELAQRKPNRRAGGPFAMNLPRGYAMLGKHDAALELLIEFKSLGRTLGYDLDSPVFAGLRGNARFQELRRHAEAWTASQPDPVDDPAPTARPR